MKLGGNIQCLEFLYKHGIDVIHGSIREKYETPAAQLYQQVLRARVDGLPEPTQLPMQLPIQVSFTRQRSNESTTSTKSTDNNNFSGKLMRNPITGFGNKGNPKIGQNGEEKQPLVRSRISSVVAMISRRRTKHAATAAANE